MTWYKTPHIKDELSLRWLLSLSVRSQKLFCFCPLLIDCSWQAEHLQGTVKVDK